MKTLKFPNQEEAYEIVDAYAREQLDLPIDLKRLPAATTTIAGTVKQAAAVADVTNAPTAEEFNALLAALRTAGIMAKD